MKNYFFSIMMGLVTMSFIACNNSKEPKSYVPNIPGENVALILTWVVDGDEATQGSAPFALYDDNGTYYVDFNGKACKVRRISPIDVGDAILCYSFTTNWGGTYYLEDISNPSNRLNNN